MCAASPVQSIEKLVKYQVYWNSRMNIPEYQHL